MTRTSSTHPAYAQRRRPERRTSISASTARTAANAVTDEAWPEGNDLVSRKSADACHSGRERARLSLTTVVISDVVTMTSTVNSAARRCLL